MGGCWYGYGSASRSFLLNHSGVGLTRRRDITPLLGGIFSIFLWSHGNKQMKGELL